MARMVGIIYNLKRKQKVKFHVSMSVDCASAIDGVCTDTATCTSPSTDRCTGTQTHAWAQAYAWVHAQAVHVHRLNSVCHLDVAVPCQRHARTTPRHCYQVFQEVISHEVDLAVAASQSSSTSRRLSIYPHRPSQSSPLRRPSNQSGCTASFFTGPTDSGLGGRLTDGLEAPQSSGAQVRY